MSNPRTYYLCVIRPIRRGPDIRDLLAKADEMNRAVMASIGDRTSKELRADPDYQAAHKAACEAMRAFKDANMATYRCGSLRALTATLALIEKSATDADLPADLAGFLHYARRHCGYFVL